LERPAARKAADGVTATHGRRVLPTGIDRLAILQHDDFQIRHADALAHIAEEPLHADGGDLKAVIGILVGERTDMDEALAAIAQGYCAGDLGLARKCRVMSRFHAARIRQGLVSDGARIGPRHPMIGACDARDPPLGIGPYDRTQPWIAGKIGRRIGIPYSD
jgi:hypothetical protein